MLPPSFLLSLAIFEPNLIPYEYRNISRTQSFCTYLPMKTEQSVPNRPHIKFRRRRITQKKAYNIVLWMLDWSVSLKYINSIL